MLQQNGRPWTVRTQMESAGTPFTVATFEPRARIFLQGDPGDSVMHIESGWVRLAVTSHSGKEAVCGLLGAGAFLGEETLAGCGVRRQSATATAATEMLVIAKMHMERLLRTQPLMAAGFIAHVLARNSRLEADLTEQLLYSSEQRLAHMLLVLADCDERHAHRRALPRVSQEIIAEMVGTTRSRVSTFMSKFKKLGFIEEEGGVLTVNPSRLSL